MAINSNSDGGWPVADSGGLSLSETMGSISGAGTLGLGSGTGNLQPSIDSLTRAVNDLAAKIGSQGIGGSSNNSNSGGSGSQQSGGSGLFPAMQNFFGNNNSGPASGIGGGGPGGAGNVQPPNTFGAQAAQKTGVAGLIASFTGYGQGQMPTQLGLNTYATMTATAMGGNIGFNQLYSQSFGFKGRNLNTNASSALDALAGTQTLQQTGANPIIGNSAIGRAAWGAANAYGVGNPSLSYAQSAAQAANIYSQQTSFNLMRMGIPTARNQNGTAKSMAAFSRGIFSSLFNNSRGNVSSQEVFTGLAPGSRASLSLGQAGINASTLEPTLQEYATLFRHNYSNAGAQKLINQASVGSRAQTTTARAKLNSLGIRTATSSVSALKTNQAQVTGRDADVASGFSAGLQDATGMLQQFNSALSSLMTTLHANGITGGLGGGLGTLGGTNHGNSLLGMGSSIGMIGAAGKYLLKGSSSLVRTLMGGGEDAAAGASAGESTGLLADLGGASAGALSPLLAVLAPLLGGVGLGMSLNKYRPKMTAGEKAMYAHGIKPGVPGYTSYSSYNQASMGGGATTISSSSQQGSSTGSKQMGGTVSGAADQAVGAARSQIGVPYHYGDELPGVGFDCSGLTQWAYKQAGVSIPRTAAEQWAALSRRAIAPNAVQEGDLVFQAGADGSTNSPGHVGMMVNSRQLIQAPYTGANVQIIGYNPKQWSHAARPSGRGGGVLPGGNGLGGTTAASTLPGIAGNMGMSIGGSYGSSEETDNVSAALGGIAGGGGYYAMGIGTGYGAAGSGSGSGGPGANSTAPGGSNAQNKAIAQSVAAKRGWTGAQWNDLDLLWTRESGFNNTIWNEQGSGAYGIAQALPASKYPLAGRPKSMGGSSNAGAQITWGLDYIAGRYTDPKGAWAHELSHGWYAGGGKVGNGISVVGERGPELMIGGSGGTVMNNSQTAAILKAAQAQPAQSPWQALSELQTIGDTNAAAQSQSCINLNFNKDSIVIKVDHAGGDVRTTGRQIAKEIVNSMAEERVLDAIRKGHKNG